jgi:hypothetical protein
VIYFVNGGRCPVFWPWESNVGRKLDQIQLWRIESALAACPERDATVLHDKADGFGTGPLCLLNGRRYVGRNSFDVHCRKTFKVVEQRNGFLGVFGFLVFYLKSFIEDPGGTLRSFFDLPTLILGLHKRCPSRITREQNARIQAEDGGVDAVVRLA